MRRSFVAVTAAKVVAEVRLGGGLPLLLPLLPLLLLSLPLLLGVRPRPLGAAPLLLAQARG